jgi:hypothetical protein
MSGFEVTHTLLRQAPQTAVVVLSMYEGDELISLTLDAGAVELPALGRLAQGDPLRDPGGGTQLFRRAQWIGRLADRPTGDRLDP